jgi:hypothetical protein
MIHDAQVEVTCDACHGSTLIALPWVYSDYSGNNGYYDSSDSTIKDALTAEDWIVSGEHQFCSKDCMEDSKETP